MSCPAILLHNRVRPHHGPWRSADADRSTPGLEAVAVLVVDDDERVRRLTARMLRSRGYVAVEAASAEAGLQRLADDAQIRIVLTDIVMPGTHGVDLAQAVREHYPHCRVLLMTGYAPELLVRFGIAEPPFPVLQKPFGSDDLIRQIRQVLGGSH